MRGELTYRTLDKVSDAEISQQKLVNAFLGAKQEMDLVFYNLERSVRLNNATEFMRYLSQVDQIVSKAKNR